MNTSSAPNREHVVSVAARLFLLRGVTNTSMEDGVRESGVSKSNIYYHFKSKSDLLAGYVGRLTDELAGRGWLAAAPSPPWSWRPPVAKSGFRPEFTVSFRIRPAHWKGS
jgi:AcrR family transcriptional regulator